MVHKTGLTKIVKMLWSDIFTTFNTQVYNSEYMYTSLLPELLTVFTTVSLPKATVSDVVHHFDESQAKLGKRPFKRNYILDQPNHALSLIRF